MNRTRNRFMPASRKIVIFGAGRIGRSFIGQLFSLSGYEVVFVDINKSLAAELSLRKEYIVVFKGNSGDQSLLIKNVRGVWLNDIEKVTTELAGASIAAISVGQQGLPGTIPLIASALLKRRKVYGEVPLDLIVAENMRNSDQYLSGELRRHLPDNYPLDKLVGLVETSIGKMAPIMPAKDIQEDPLQVFAEPYNTLIVAKKSFRNPIPPVDNLEPRENIKAWVDRKLFIHNLGHAASAYLGFQKHPGAVYIYEVLNDPVIHDSVRKTMMQSGDILMASYPGEFDPRGLEEHIDDLLYRFGNKSLGDTLFRVGCDLYRKVGPEDRLVAPIKAAMKLNKPYDLILRTLRAAITFRAADENGRYYPSDISFFSETSKGIPHILENICGLKIPDGGQGLLQ